MMRRLRSDWIKRIAQALLLVLLLCCLLYGGRDRPSKFVPAGGEEEERYEWIDLLIPDSAQEDYAFANIAVRGKEAQYCWSSFPDRESLLEALEQERSVCPPSADGTVSWRFVKVKLNQDIFALDIRDWLESNLSEEGYVYQAITDGEGDSFGFFQLWNSALEEEGMLRSKRLFVIRDGFLYGLSCLGVTEQNREAAAEQLMYYEFECAMKTDALYPGGWVMDEEILYWVDHKERKTQLEGPRRFFIERQAQDTTWPDRIMGRFGMLTQAEYQVNIVPQRPEYTVTFQFIEEIPEDGYSTYLFNGYCMDEPYHMEVKDSRGRLLQGKDLDLCIEKTDTITFEDLDHDGCLDMKILYPRHEFESMSGYGYWLWNEQAQKFENVRESEIFLRQHENKEEETVRRIVVKPGDSLWRLAAVYYGDGRRYPEIYEKNKAVIGPEPSLIHPGTELILP